MKLLVFRHESALTTWCAASDTPEDFTEKRIEATVGIEMIITRLSGKWKVSQNQLPQGQRSVIQRRKMSKLFRSCY